jgi:AcrR family transcriptional regulator
MLRSTPRKTRDSEMTRKRLIGAVGTLLAREGFKALGINAVARQAGVDKVLIYRYFGGMPGLIKAFGQEGDFWPSLQELAGGDMASFSALSQAERLSAMARNFMQAIRKRPLTQAIMAWEIVEKNELTEELEVIRENNIMRFFELFFPSTGLNGRDVQAIVGLVGAGISYLIIRSNKIRSYSGIDLTSEQGWQRLADAIDSIITGLVSTDR